MLNSEIEFTKKIVHRTRRSTHPYKINRQSSMYFIFISICSSKNKIMKEKYKI